MNSQQLLFLNFLIVFAIVLLFFWGRSKPRHLGLKVTPPEENPATEADDNVISLDSRHIEKPAEGPPCFFVYNGHEWEAHEVLGLERGGDIAKATVSYQKLIKTSDPGSFEFYDAAYSALLKSRRP